LFDKILRKPSKTVDDKVLAKNPDFEIKVRIYLLPSRKSQLIGKVSTFMPKCCCADVETPGVIVEEYGLV